MFLFHDKSPVTFNDDLPDAVDVVIIGAGIIGISTAWYLLQKGKSVLVCEKGRVAGEQSSRNWGWVRVTGRDADEVPIAIESVSRWDELSKELGPELGFARQGVLALADSEPEMAGYEEWLEIAKTHQLDTKLLTSAEATDHINGATGNWRGGMITPSDGRAEPFKAVPAIARAIRQKGGTIKENCAVRTIDVQAGKVCGVATEAGYVKTDAVLCAAGAWSNMFLSNMDILLPQLVVQGTVARTVAAPSVYEGAAGLGDIFIRRRQDKGYTVASAMTVHTIGANSFRYLTKFIPSLRSASDIRVKLGRDRTQQPILIKKWGADSESPFERCRVLNPDPSSNAVRDMKKNLGKRLPLLAGIEFAQSWSGMIDVTPDVVPVMDKINSCPGLFVATGFSGHGFGIGPGAGRVMADLILGNDPMHDLSRFRFSRFTDGSKMMPGPAI
ncbi:MAG: FAD-dependent oxidoreductase [Oceanobacter sp.]|jgi:glycine/D-amino acid oxidase-like deaminating enzyme|nr:MAG: FAD-dependent oxidoreductase [Oceanobacter sp.]|tara:strand:- start:1391 stop:2719 length:1329 start_codon:yes stop_codon:yes gene_type:complete